MNITFEKKRVLVTGAGRGIGRELAKAFALGKAEKVFALSRTNSYLNELVAECPNITPVCVDLSDWNATRSAVESLGPIDILVNNAGMTIVEPFVDIAPENFDTLMNVNLKSVINVSQVVVKGMISRKSGGSIVNVSSQSSKVAFENHSVYGASKAALDLLTKTMALELGKYNIRVNAVNPTVVWTELARSVWENTKKYQDLLDRTPLHRVAEYPDVVNVILFLASDKSGIVNATNLPIEGGFLSVF